MVSRRGEGQRVRARRRRGVVAVFLLTVAGALGGCGVAPSSPRDRARAAYLKQDYAGAAKAYEEYLANNPTDPDVPEARLTLADVYYHNLKQFEPARDHYAAYLALYPDGEHTYEAREHLAEVSVELKDLREAIAQYETLLEEHPNPPDWRKIRSTIADLYYRLEDFNQAEIEYTRVVENASYDELTEQALLRLASIAHRIRNRGELAVPMYERVAAASSDPAVRRAALKSLSEVYADLFRFDEAVATLKRIDDPSEADYVIQRTAELEKQRREHAEAPEVDWSRGHPDGG